ncbi:MAG: SDR family oxidoreductase [Planctomycetota bacterium]|jgi:NAD(P)-dependent dehydrogenase (short-subunit alcohol dehydrogenase family)
MKEARRVVVTGAGRGLGMEFVLQYLRRGWEVHALLRKPEGSNTIQRLLKEHPATLAASACDVADQGSVAAAAAAVSQRWSSLDVLINNAGINGTTNSSMQRLDMDDLRKVFEVNTIGPIEVSRAVLPLLQQGTDPRIVHITSKMGSIDDNASGGWWAYRISKAALNMACANMAHELRDTGIATMVIHPGWVRTDMGGRMAPLGVEESVSGMIEVIDGLRLRDSGCCRDYTGAEVPW